METRIGVWIDHRKALIIASEDTGIGRPDGVVTITTDLEKQLRLSSGARAKTTNGPQDSPPDNMREASSQENLRAFFGQVIEAVRGARSIFIFGPGEAKDEFKKRLEREGLGERIRGVETVGRLSDRQIAAKVRSHFQPRIPT
jgi:HEAT repeat protein